MKSEKDVISEPATAEFKHFPSLDGLRGIAILAVIAFHAGNASPALAPATRWGFLGVQLFFVLSGFLITSILIKEYGKFGTISLKNFYVRRFLRLVPAYWAFLLFVYFLGGSFQSAEESAVLYGDRHFIAAFLYLSNWQNIASSTHIPEALIHLWSLAVEEQFYICWSLAIWLFIRFKASRQQMFASVAVFILLAMAFRVWRVSSGVPDKSIYFSTSTYLDGLLIGGLASMVYMWKLVSPQIYDSRYFKLLAALAFFAIPAVSGYVTVFYRDSVFYFAGQPAFSLACGIIILYLATKSKTYVNSLLEFAPLQFLGRISYGLYLWNTIAFIIAKNLFQEPIFKIIFAVALTFGFAVISFYKIEEPFLKLKSKFV